MSRSTELLWIVILCGGLAAAIDAGAVLATESELQVLCEPSLRWPLRWDRDAARQAVRRRWAKHRQTGVGLCFVPVAVWLILDAWSRRKPH